MSESLRKAMSILDALHEHEAALSVRELAEMLELSKSTTQRLLRSLEEARLTVQDAGTRKYRLGPKTLTLGMAYRDRLDLRNVALPHMRTLRDATDETVGLSIVVGHERMFTEEVQSQSELRAHSELGYPYPLWTGAPGRVLLAYLPAAQARSALERADEPAWRSLGLPSKQALHDRLNTIRHTRHDRAFDETINGVSALAVPVLDATTNIAAALSISGPSARMGNNEMDRMLTATHTAAEHISRALGGC